MIPMCDLQQQYQTLKREIDEAMQQVAAEGRYILGPNVAAFEKEVAAYCDCQHAAGVANGTDALHLALRALRIGPGDEVITTPFTFVATTEAIGIVGAKPVFVDIDPQTYNMDVTKIEAAITPRTKVIMPVHLYGQPCDMDAIGDIAQRHQLAIVEDCAQAIGATYKGRKVGSFGDAGCISFFPSKNLGAFGDAGMVVSNNAEVFERVEMLRRHGGKIKYRHCELGLNSRLDELQAAILRVKFRQLDAWSDARRRHAVFYNRALSTLANVVCPQEISEQGTIVAITPSANRRVRCVYHQYTIRVENRDAIGKQLTAAGVSNMVYYPVPLHLQDVHRDLGLGRGSFPVAEEVADHCLSLPMFPELTESQQTHVINAVRSAVESASPGSLRLSA